MPLIRSDTRGALMIFTTSSLSFAKIEVVYKPQKPDGSLGAGERFGYDLKANKAF